MSEVKNYLKGRIKLFDPISSSGEIYVEEDDISVVISESKENNVFFQIINELEFYFEYTKSSNIYFFKNHLINHPDQKEAKEELLFRYLIYSKKQKVLVTELINDLGFERKGTRLFFEELQKKDLINYRLSGPGEFSYNLLTKNKNKSKVAGNHSIEELYVLSRDLPALQRVEFQKSMDITNSRLKFLNSSWEEIVEVINLRLGVTQAEYLDDLKNFDNANKLDETIQNQSIEDKERDKNLLDFGIAETNAERDSRLEKQRKEREAKEKAIEAEKKKNHAETGHLETNLERANREEKEKILEERRVAKEKEEQKLLEERKANFAETGIYESDNERTQRENLSESVEVDVDLLNKRRKYGDKKRQFVKNLSIGNRLEAEIMHITEKVYWVEVDGIKAMMPKVVVSSHLGEFKKGELVPVEVINLDLKRLHITLKPIARNKQKKPSTRKPVTKKASGTTPTNLAEELGINPKSLRAWLRINFARSEEDKNKRWYLSEKEIRAAKQHFSKVKKPAVKKPTTKKPSLKTKSSKLDDFFETYLLSSKNKQATKLFGEYTKKALKIYGADETSLTFPTNKKKVRLINSGIESAWISNEGLMTVVINDHNTSAELLFIINKFVEQKNRKNCYKKLPEAVPLFIEHEFIKQYKNTLKKSFDIFLKHCEKTGKNPWKKYHEPEIVNYLNKVQLKNIDFSS